MGGLLLGGTITGLLGWRWVFLVMAPLALGNAAAARAVLPEARAANDDGSARRPDVAGAVLVTSALMALIFGLTRAEHAGIASGIFETANHLFGGAVGVAIYATLISAASYRAAFLGATALAALGVVAAAQASPRAARRAG